MVRENIIKCLRRNPRKFIQAFFDCEGSISGFIVGNGRFDFELMAANTDLEILEEIQEELENMGVSSSLYLHHSRGRIITTRKGTAVASKECYVLCVAGVQSIMNFEEKIGFCISRKKEKLRDIVHILRRFGKGVEAAIEWIRRYEYLTEMGRERWYKRKKILCLNNAKMEYKSHLALLKQRRAKK